MKLELLLKLIDDSINLLFVFVLVRLRNPGYSLVKALPVFSGETSFNSQLEGQQVDSSLSTKSNNTTTRIQGQK